MNKSLYSILSSVVLLSILWSCSLTPNNFKSKLSWLENSWTCNYQQKYAEESWIWDSDKKCYSAIGLMTQNLDTIYTQKLKIHKENEDLFLSVHTEDNNRSKEAFFKLINNNSDSLVFQNIFDKFPKFIIYINSNGKLKTKALGLKNGQNIVDYREYNIQKKSNN